MSSQSAEPRFAGPADLHLHSNHSDGTESPAEVIVAAYAHGVRTVALTDHDTTSGWEEAAAQAAQMKMTFIPGIELSARLGWRSIHMLGYLFDPDHPDLRAELARIRDDRVGRAERIARNIARDYPLRWDDVVAQTTSDATVGRPHIADALVAAGIVSDRTAAFSGILHPGAGYYESHYAPDPVRAIELIRAAGGVPVIAHPATISRDHMLPVAELERLVAHGLAGIEIDHRENTVAGKRILTELAARHDLILTGSSDYHGSGKPNRPGEHTTSVDMVARIIAQASGTPPRFAG